MAFTLSKIILTCKELLSLQYVQIHGLTAVSSKTICSSSALCWRPRNGNIPLVIHQSVRLASASVCMVMSGFGMLLTWWDELSILLIHQCISDTVFEDTLIFPSKLPS